MSHFDSDVELLRTCHLYESDMLSEALEKVKIPFCRIQEEFGGVQVAPVLSPQSGLGLTFLVIVPAAMERQARAILDALPIRSNPYPGLMDFTASPKIKTGIRVFAWIALVTFFILSTAQLFIH